ncbi:MAG: hypothetical protein SVP52_02295, partial [Chloroflexota bacterium]|nr:hypothetical protein [Chloroflexota bacterium]
MTAVGQAFVSATMTAGLQHWKVKAPFRVMMKDFLRVFIIFAVFLVGLELRKSIYEGWGKTIVTIYTTTLG